VTYLATLLMPDGIFTLPDARWHLASCQCRAKKSKFEEHERTPPDRQIAMANN
jgi:hypothetical protein